MGVVQSFLRMEGQDSIMLSVGTDLPVLENGTDWLEGQVAERQEESNSLLTQYLLALIQLCDQVVASHAHRRYRLTASGMYCTILNRRHSKCLLRRTCVTILSGCPWDELCLVSPFQYRPCQEH